MEEKVIVTLVLGSDFLDKTQKAWAIKEKSW